MKFTRFLTKDIITNKQTTRRLESWHLQYRVL